MPRAGYDHVPEQAALICEKLSFVPLQEGRGRGGAEDRSEGVVTEVSRKATTTSDLPQ